MLQLGSCPIKFISWWGLLFFHVSSRCEDLSFKYCSVHTVQSLTVASMKITDWRAVNLSTCLLNPSRPWLPCRQVLLSMVNDFLISTVVLLQGWPQKASMVLVTYGSCRQAPAPLKLQDIRCILMYCAFRWTVPSWNSLPSSLYLSLTFFQHPLSASHDLSLSRGKGD